MATCAADLLVHRDQLRSPKTYHFISSGLSVNGLADPPLAKEVQQSGSESRGPIPAKPSSKELLFFITLGSLDHCINALTYSENQVSPYISTRI